MEELAEMKMEEKIEVARSWKSGQVQESGTGHGTLIVLHGVLGGVGWSKGGCALTLVSFPQF